MEEETKEKNIDDLSKEELNNEIDKLAQKIVRKAQQGEDPDYTDKEAIIFKNYPGDVEKKIKEYKGKEDKSKEKSTKEESEASSKEESLNLSEAELESKIDNIAEEIIKSHEADDSPNLTPQEEQIFDKYYSRVEKKVNEKTKPSFLEEESEAPETGEDIYRLISNAESLDELIDVFNKEIGDSRDSQGRKIDSDRFQQIVLELEQEIKDMGGVPPEFRGFKRVTRKFGLRDKVEDLLREKFGTKEVSDVHELKETGLERLSETRDNLIEAEEKLRDYNGILGSLKGIIKKKEKNELESKYQEALADYQSTKEDYLYNVISKETKDKTEQKRLRAQFVTNEKITLTEERIQYFKHEAGIGEELKEMYKWLGKQNLAKLLGKDFMSKFEKHEDDSKVTKFLKGGARFISNAMSVRLGVSMSLIGVAGLFGGTFVAAGAYGLKRSLVGLGTGFTSYDLMSKFSEGKKLEKVKEGVNKEEISNLSDEEIIEKMAYFEKDAENQENIDEGYEVLDSETYQILLQELENRIKENKISEDLRNLIKNTDKALENERKKYEKGDKKRKIIAGGIGAFFASGALGKIIEKIWPGGEEEAGQEAVSAQEEVSPEPEPGAEVKAGSELEPEVEAKPEPEVEAEPKAEPEPEVKPEAKPEPQPELESESKPEPVAKPEQVPAETKIGYQGGSSIWEESKNQLDTRLSGVMEGGIDDLGPAEQTHLIDHFKDRLAESPEEFGLKPGTDVDELTKEQIKNIKWDKLFDLTDQENVADLEETLQKTLNLSEEAKENILENNRILENYAQKTGESIDTENVDQLLSDIKEAGDVDQYIASQSTSDALPMDQLDLRSDIGNVGAINNIIKQGQNIFENEESMEAIKDIAKNNGFGEDEVNLFEYWSKYQVENDLTPLQGMITRGQGNFNAEGFKRLMEGFEDEMKNVAQDLSKSLKEPGGFLGGVFKNFKKPFVEWGKDFGLDKKESLAFYKHLIDEQGSKEEVFESLKEKPNKIYDWFLDFKSETTEIASEEVSKEATQEAVAGTSTEEVTQATKESAEQATKEKVMEQTAQETTPQEQAAPEQVSRATQKTAESSEAAEVGQETDDVTPEQKAPEQTEAEVQSVEQETDQIAKQGSESAEEVGRTQPNESAQGAFEELDANQSALKTFENSNLSYQERVAELRDIIPNEEKIQLGTYELARQGDKVYLVTGPQEGVEITKENIDQIAQTGSAMKQAAVEEAGQDMSKAGGEEATSTTEPEPSQSENVEQAGAETAEKVNDLNFKDPDLGEVEFSRSSSGELNVEVDTSADLFGFNPDEKMAEGVVREFAHENNQSVNLAIQKARHYVTNIESHMRLLDAFKESNPRPEAYQAFERAVKGLYEMSNKRVGGALESFDKWYKEVQSS